MHRENFTRMDGDRYDEKTKKDIHCHVFGGSDESYINSLRRLR